TDSYHQKLEQVGYTLEQLFSDNWSLKNAFRASFRQLDQSLTGATSLSTDNQTLNRLQISSQYSEEAYNMATDLVGKFFTGSIEHKLLFGFDLSRIDERT
ncbi:MAG: TonB-dependent siderophore receptor, partial [Nostoc sp.]